MNLGWKVGSGKGSDCAAAQGSPRGLATSAETMARIRTMGERAEAIGAHLCSSEGRLGCGLGIGHEIG